MTIFDRLSYAVALIGATSFLALSERTAFAQQRPPLRELGPVISISDALGALSGMQQLSDGRVLVNDPARRQLLLLDSALRVIRVVADTSPATGSSYGLRGGGLLAYRGDSSLFIDPASFSMLVIDPTGTPRRVMAAPRAEDLPALLGGPRGRAGFDSQQRLVYQKVLRNAGTNKPPASGQVLQTPDSAPLVRFNLETRGLDTAAFIKVQGAKFIVLRTETGTQLSPVIDPLPLVDDWTLLSDGTIAILRKDYHVDFIAGDGGKSSGKRIPFDWQRLSDSAKVELMESVRISSERLRAAGPPSGFVPLGANVSATGTQNPPSVSFLDPRDLPDYKPAFAAGALNADAEGRLWVRIIPTREIDPVAGRPQYDVLDRTGKLVDCVALPKGTTIAGFGPGGIVYLGIKDTAGVHLVRARVR